MLANWLRAVRGRQAEGRPARRVARRLGVECLECRLTPSNVAPSFVAGPDQVVPVGARPQTVTGWAAAVSANDPGQAVDFQVVANSNPGLIAVGPVVNPAGDLTFTPTAGVTGTAVLRLALHDDGGTAGGGQDTSPAQTFVVSVSAGQPVVRRGTEQTLVGPYAVAVTEPAPAVGLAADGSYVVAWVGEAADYSNAIYAQRYTPSGTAAGSVVTVAATADGELSQPAVAVAGDGRFVVAWSGAAAGLAGTDVFVRRYDATGTATGGAAQVNATSGNGRGGPAVAVGPDGAFVVAWADAAAGGQPDVLGRWYDSTGGTVGGPTVLNSAGGWHSRPAVAMAADGSTVAVWQSYQSAATNWDVVARRFDPAGTPLTGEVAVNVTTAGAQMDPAVASDARGGFVVAWTSDAQAADPDGYGVAARRFAADGTPAGAEFDVNQATAGWQVMPAVAADARGGFLVAWTGGDVAPGGGDYDVLARRYDATGAATGAEMRVNSTQPGLMFLPAVAATADGGYAVAWERVGSGSATVFAQRYDWNTAPTSLILSPSAIPEDAAGGVVVGQVSAADSNNPDDTFVYTLLDSAGGRFALTGTNLKVVAGAAFDYETEPTVTVRVRVTDLGGAGLTLDRDLTVTVTDVNEAPTSIALSNVAAAENQPAGTPVGTLSATDPDTTTQTLTFSLPTGLTDNALFAVSGTQLQTAASFDYESRQSYTVTVRVTDQGGLQYDKTFTVTVADLNERPTAVAATLSVPENSPAGAAVGTAVGTDPDALAAAGSDFNVLRYSLTDDAGGRFAVDPVSGVVTVAAGGPAIDYEANQTFSVTVRVTDLAGAAGGLSYDQPFTVTVTDVNEAPTAVGFGPAQDGTATAAEHATVGAVFGTLTTADPDVLAVPPGSLFNTHQYTLTDSAGGRFILIADQLQVADQNALDYESASVEAGTGKHYYDVAVRTTDLNGAAGGLPFDRSLRVYLTDVVEPAVAPGGLVVSGGQAQRSMLKSLTVMFTEVMATASDPAATLTTERSMFTLVRGTTGGGTTDESNLLVVQWTVVGGVSVATVTFAGAGVVGGSLADGRYRLTIAAGALVGQTTGLTLDGDGDAVPGGGYGFGTLTGSPTAAGAQKMFRLYGDSDGNAQTDTADYTRFRASLGSRSVDSNYRAEFDYTSDGQVDTTDFTQFRARLGTQLT